jgi:hypothetical protein
MRVLLAGPDYEENLSIRYLSGALLRAGHETTLSMLPGTRIWSDCPYVSRPGRMNS